MAESCYKLEYENDMLPGFRFHPTDEELVDFYLRRRVENKPFPFELIAELDIYKFDPWELAKMSTLGESQKDWYFFCPRDRKYRNSSRPNRVTVSGFWKATGTDRPIYSKGASNCVGLKKSLVFYKGKAAQGTKTEWMMHEFRLPTDNSGHESSFALCRIVKRKNVGPIPSFQVHPKVMVDNERSAEQSSMESKIRFSPSLSSAQNSFCDNSWTIPVCKTSMYSWDEEQSMKNAFSDPPEPASALCQVLKEKSSSRIPSFQLHPEYMLCGTFATGEQSSSEESITRFSSLQSTAQNSPSRPLGDNGWTTSCETWKHIWEEEQSTENVDVLSWLLASPMPPPTGDSWKGCREEGDGAWLPELYIC